MVTRVMLGCLACALVIGCKSREEPTRGAFDTAKPAVEKAEPRKPKRFIDTPDIELASAPTVFEEELEEDDPERDLAAELQEAVGSPAGCLTDYEAPVPTRVRVPVSATVRPSGVVIQPSAPGSGLSDRARQCIEERIRLVKLSPLPVT